MTIEIDNEEVKNAMYAGTLLMSNLNSLITNNYSNTKFGIECSTATGGFRYIFIFKSIQANRIIRVSYSQPTNKTTLHSFNLSIEFKSNRVYLKDLINEHNLFDNINYLNLKNHEGNTKQKIEGVVQFIDKVFIDHFQNIINGKEWENIGFDWQGYK